MAIISFGRLSLKLLYPLSMALTGLISMNLIRIANSSYGFNHPWIICILTFLGESLNGVVYLIFNACTTTNSESVSFHRLNKDVSGIKLVESIPDHERSYVYLYILLCSLLDICSGFLFSISLLYTNDNSYDLGVDIHLIFFTCILCRLFLGYKVHRHHMISLGLILLGNFFVMIYFSYGERNLLWGILWLSSAQLFLSIQEVTEKWLMQHKFVHPYKLVWLEGMSGSVICGCLVLIFNYIRCPSIWIEDEDILCSSGNGGHYLENFTQAWGLIMDNQWLLGLLITFLLSETAFNAMRTMTSHKYTPTHRTVADTLRSILMYIIIFATTTDYNGMNLIMKIFGFLIIIMGSLIYNELIILRFWSLETKTAVELEKRAIIDKTFNEEEITSRETSLLV